jgi:release factor glutamine methyltransferase
MTDERTVAVMLEEAVQRLRAAHAAGVASPELDAQLLLAHVLRVPRAHLSAHPEQPLDALHAGRYLQLLGRRASGVPLAYLTGEREFWSLTLSVSPAVLVPRPETELLVERALALTGADEVRVADLGTGSGAVALAIASERPRWRVIATDVSAEALDVARGNAARLGLTGVEFRRGHWFEPLGGERFDLLVSNPPYVAAGDPALDMLTHEPALALTAGADGLAALRILVQGAPRYLAPGGWLLLEHGAGQGAEVRHALVLAGFGSVRSHRDLGGHERMTEAQHGQI